MKARQRTHFRWGRTSPNEHVIMLLLIIVVSLFLVRFFAPESLEDQRPLWDRLLASALGLAQCFGLFVGLSILLASFDVLKQTLHRYQNRLIEKKLAKLAPLLKDARPHATVGTAARLIRLLHDRNALVRKQSLAALFSLLRAGRELTLSETEKQSILQALKSAPGFLQTLIETPFAEDLLSRVTLGAKMGAGTSEKRLAPVTSDPEALSQWVEEHRREHGNPEIQVSIGFDTGGFPYQHERSRFLGLLLYIATTDREQFQALMRRPTRDPNAAFGLVIRGDVVEPRYPGQMRGHRLDFVFPLPIKLSQANLAGLIRQIQLLNLGLLTASTLDSVTILLGHLPNEWIDERREAIARIYREFERKLLRLLRRFDRYRDPQFIHPLLPADHLERCRAIEKYRLEECLYPQYRWVVPLYDPDTRWDQLLTPLRAVEAMILHQGPVENTDLTRGVEFIHCIRRLAYETANSIDGVLQGKEVIVPLGATSDPFIDAADEEATRWYLQQVGSALTDGLIGAEDLPDPTTFRSAVNYYKLDPEKSFSHSSSLSPEAES